MAGLELFPFEARKCTTNLKRASPGRSLKYLMQIWMNEQSLRITVFYINFPPLNHIKEQSLIPVPISQINNTCHLIANKTINTVWLRVKISLKRNLHSTDTPKGSTGSTIGRICQPKRSTMAQKQFKLIVQALLATDWLAILLNYYTPLIYNDSLTAITGFYSMSSHI